MNTDPASTDQATSGGTGGTGLPGGGSTAAGTMQATGRPAGDGPPGQVREDASSDAVPADAVPDDAVPADAVPDDAVPDDAVPGGPDLGALQVGEPERRGPGGLVVALLAVIGLALVSAAFALGTLVSGDGGRGGTGRGGAAAPGEDSVDVGFARDMSAHHNQAVEMAGIVRDRGTDPDLRLVAFDIETGQNNQVGQMQGWLQVWGRSPNSSGPLMTWMSEDGGAGHHHGPGGVANASAMPGMASEAEMATLHASTGKALDVLFLQLMIRHHQGGLPMARYAEEHATEPEVRNLASKMVVAQSNEVVQMEQMLRERGGTPLPPPS